MYAVVTFSHILFRISVEGLRETMCVLGMGGHGEETRYGCLNRAQLS
jgi:hypothetical protein